MFSKSCLQREENVALLAVGIGNHRPFQLQLGWILHVSVGRFGDRLAGVFRQHRLGIKALHMAHAAIHEEPDHALGLRSKMRPAIGGGPAGWIGQSLWLVTLQQCRQGHAGDPAPKRVEDLAPGGRLLRIGGVAGVHGGCATES